MPARRRKKTSHSLANAPAAAPASRGRTPPRRALRIIVICCLALGAFVYAQGIPLGKGPDETAHLRYIEFLARHHRLPVFDPANPDPDYEFHQPPLYYLLCLPTYLLAGGEGPNAQQSLRFFTLLLSIALLYLTFALASALAPDRPWAAPAAAGVVAFLPMHLSLSTTVGNDLLSEIFAAAALLLMVRYLRASAADQPPGLAAPAAAGLMIGLGMLTKSIAVLLFPVCWLAAALAARSAAGFRWRQLLRDLALITLIALALSGWWLARNQLRYGDPLANRAFLQAFQGRRPSPQQFMRDYQVSSPASYVGEVMIWTAASVTGVFGPVRANRFAFFPYWVYFLTGLLAAAAAIGFARYLARADLAPWQRQAWWVCAAFALLLLASFIRFNFSFFQAQARYLFPALPPAALAFSLGLQELSPARFRQTAPLVAVAALALLGLLGLPLWIIPQFALP